MSDTGAARALTIKRPANSSADSCDWQCYLDRYADLQRAFGDSNLEAAKRHWAQSGKASGRKCHCDSAETVEVHGRQLESESTFEPAPKVFLYEFTHSPISYKLTDGGPCAAGAEGAFHGAELPYVFHVRSFFKTQYERELGDYMAQYWRNFAYSGDPNIPPPWHERTHNETLPTWPEFRNHTEDYLELGTAPDGSVEARQVYNSNHCTFWADYRRAKMNL